MNQRLKQLRESHRFSQKQTAEALGISQSAYSQIEKGTVSLSVEHLKTLSSRYGVTIDWLVRGEGLRQLPETKEEFISLVQVSAISAYILKYGDTEFIRDLPVCKLPGCAGREFRIFEVSGEGMKPYIFPQDYLVCERVQQERASRQGSLFLLVTPDKFVLRRNTDKDSIYLDLVGSEVASGLQVGEQVNEVWEVKSRFSTHVFEGSADQEQRIHKLEDEFREVKDQLTQLLESSSLTGQ